MANTLGGINLADVAQRTIAALVPHLFKLSMISTDFSDEMANPAESITTRIPTATTADDVSGGFTASDQTSTAVTISLNLELGKAIAFTSAELSKGGIDKVIQTFVPTVVNAVGLGVTQELIKLMIAANFSSVSTVAAAAFDADAVADIAQAQDEANVMQEGRFMLLKPAPYTNLAKDNVIQQVDASGSSEALRNHRVGRVSGYQLEQFTGFPTSGQTVTENLHGFCGHKSALAMAARMPAMTEQGRDIVDVVEIADPETGFPMQFQQFYDPLSRKHYFAVATLFGVKVGNAASGRRIASA